MPLPRVMLYIIHNLSPQHVTARPIMAWLKMLLWLADFAKVAQIACNKLTFEITSETARCDVGH